jgi:hypothetical protein
MRTLLILALALAAPAMARSNAEDGERELAKALAGATPGKPQSCLSSFQRQEGRNIPGIGMLYGWGRNFYLNRFQNGCPSLDSSTAIVTRTPTGDLCRGDIARIIDTSTRFERGSCILGDFVPYTKPKSR